MRLLRVDDFKVYTVGILVRTLQETSLFTRLSLGVPVSLLPSVLGTGPQDTSNWTVTQSRRPPSLLTTMDLRTRRRHDRRWSDVVVATVVDLEFGVPRVSGRPRSGYSRVSSLPLFCTHRVPFTTLTFKVIVLHFLPGFDKIHNFGG